LLQILVKVRTLRIFKKVKYHADQKLSNTSSFSDSAAYNTTKNELVLFS
jgi:hypothetical protein